ncbi:MAG: FAD-dependent oxidoreductase [Actinobacteria bacterium]|nr:FAD-dependent oxidoreductase [Actinomycetota bacterium]
METTRRNFFKLAGVTAVGAATAGLAGCGSSAKASTGEKVVGWTEIEFSQEVDVLIIGSGPSGLMCAYQTAGAGLNTLLVDKEITSGGVARYSAGVQNYFGSEYGKEKRGLTTYEEMADTMVEFHNGKAHPDIAEQYSIYTGKVQDLLGSDFGIEWAEPVAEPSYISTWLPKDGLGQASAMFDAIHEKVSAAGAAFLFENKCTSLITDANDEVVGARFVDILTGENTDIKAANVVIATGSFASNQEMIAEYLPDWTTIGCITIHSTGDGFALGQAVGGVIDGVGKYLNMNSHSEAIFVSQMFGPSLCVLQNGRRFFNETKVHKAATSCVAAGSGNWWSIWDEQLDKGPNAKQVESAGAGKITANTVEELAAAMNVPLSELQATFDEYKTMCETQTDPAFERKLFLTELQPPYYAFNNHPVRYKTLGGLLVNIDTQMLDANEEIIPHMFCTGIMGLSDYSADIAPSFASGMYCGTRIVALNQQA